MSATLAELRRLLQRREGGTAPRLPASSPPRSEGDTSETACSSFLRDLAPGEIQEWVASSAGCGAAELACTLIVPQLPPRARWLVIAPVPDLDPTFLCRRGLDLSRIVFVRPDSAEGALWAVEQGLRSRGVEVVWCRLPRLTPVMFRRLKLAAEVGHSRCLLMRPPTALREGSWADRRFRVSGLPSSRWGLRRVKVEVLKVRNGLPGGVIQVELDHETGAVRMVPELGCAARRAQ